MKMFCPLEQSRCAIVAISALKLESPNFNSSVMDQSVFLPVPFLVVLLKIWRLHINRTELMHLSDSLLTLRGTTRGMHMMNYIWFVLFAVGILVGMFTGTLDEVTAATLEAGKTAVTLAIGLIGVMALWLGLMRVAEKAGLVRIVARLLQPVMKRIFPEIPPDHPAMGSMLANIAANMLGLGNSATALGLKAMEDLQSINQDKDSASNAMATFLAINTSSVTIIPATVIAVRISAGATNATEIIGPAIIATGVSTTVGIIAARLLQKAVPPQKASSPENGNGHVEGGDHA